MTSWCWWLVDFIQILRDWPRATRVNLSIADTLFDPALAACAQRPTPSHERRDATHDRHLLGPNLPINASATCLVRRPN